jgi:hypothetical protein
MHVSAYDDFRKSDVEGYFWRLLQRIEVAVIAAMRRTTVKADGNSGMTALMSDATVYCAVHIRTEPVNDWAVTV